MIGFAAALCLLLLLAAPLARADEPPPAPGCSIGGTNMIPVDKGEAKGDVTINCSGLTEAFGNQLNEILNRILQERLDPQMVMAKLSEVDRVPEEGVARVVNDDQRQQLIRALTGKPSEMIAITAHPAVDDSAEFAKGIAMALMMVGWQIDGQQIRRIAPKALDPVHGVAVVVKNRDTAPAKAAQLKAALASAHIAASLISDPSLAPDAALLWIGRRPQFMAPPDAPK